MNGPNRTEVDIMDRSKQNGPNRTQVDKMDRIEPKWTKWTK